MFDQTHHCRLQRDNLSGVESHRDVAHTVLPAFPLGRKPPSGSMCPGPCRRSTYLRSPELRCRQAWEQSVWEVLVSEIL